MNTPTAAADHVDPQPTVTAQMVREAIPTSITVACEVTIELHGYDGKMYVPGFWQELGTISDETSPVASIGNSMSNPLVTFLMAREGHQGPNHGFLATVNLQPALTAALNRMPEALRTANTALEAVKALEVAEGVAAARAHVEG